ncbi:MAG: hypothetical protein WCV56_06510 [Candidatus Omnitrophota bacterium]
MNEKEFWDFLADLQRPGKISMLSGSISSGAGPTDSIGNYMSGHSILPAEHQDFPQKIVEQLGNLLFLENVRSATKEAILILLAHQPSKYALEILEKYNLSPAKELEIFAEIALEECYMWNE